jgi:hypothetical protein
MPKARMTVQEVVEFNKLEGERVLNGRLLGGSAGVFAGMLLHLSGTCINPLLFVLPLVAGYLGGEANRDPFDRCSRFSFFSSQARLDKIAMERLSVMPIYSAEVKYPKKRE